ncbi:MAG: hypothetical protein MRERC_4c021 [Mycoplasmataceae bacterium RC_NB112A]|nr:MAG: hypothetical protein MRERC_4c021 [Mycoplasmataceae bacterium RC_NB112A]
MKNQTYNQKVSSLTKLIKNRFPSTLTRRIELDDQFFAEAQKFANERSPLAFDKDNETLNFSHYPELEQIINTSKVQGVIKKIDVSQNPNLTELVLPNQKLTRLDLSKNSKLITLQVNNNQLVKLNLDHNPHLECLNVADNEITGTWEFTKCAKLKFFACRNNYLNELRINKDLRDLLINSDWKNLQPQKHVKNNLHPIKDVTYVTLLESQDTKTENKKNEFQDEQPQPKKLPLNWKSFYRWLQSEIIENDSLQVKLKLSQRTNYRKVSENALNRFVNSLEATLDNNSFFHLFPDYDDNKSFEELFDFNKIFCGKKSDKKKIGEASYGDLEKLFYNWRKISVTSQGQSEQTSFEEEVELATSDRVRNILLIGRTGSGKSTLANVLVNKNDKFEEIFKESTRSISETKQIQTEEFSVDISKDGQEKINYRVIDTIGFGDTQLSNKRVLELLQDLVPIIGDDGLNQILFVTDGRFTEKEIETYKLLESVLFDKNVVKYTTIVRVKFPEFEELNECDEDRKALREENEEMFRILKNSKIIYADNPPLVGRSLNKNKEIREESNKRLLTYLATCQKIYHPANLTEFKRRIDDYRTKSEQLEKEQSIRKQEEKLQSDIRAAQTKQQIDLELNRRKFEQRLENTKNGYEWKLKYAQEQLENKYQEQLKNSQQRYERERNEAESCRQAEIERIKSNYENRRVWVGEAVCSLGHSNVTGYNKYDCQPDQDDFEDSLSYVYCATCDKNDYNYRLISARTYNFEEWCRMRNQSYDRELEEMNRQIQDQERRKQEVIARIHQEKNEREAVFQKELGEQRKLQAQIIEKQRKIDEERAKQQEATQKGQIDSASQEKMNRLNRELVERKLELENQVRQSQIKKENARWNLETFIEQNLYK